LELYYAPIVLIVCPLLGGLPLIAWITYALTGKKLQQLGTGNVGVQAAFYHGGTLVGVLAVLSEAFKGIAAVWLARSLFPTTPVWELVALMALVAGRYWFGKGAGTTNVVWGVVVHDPIVAGLVFLIGGISFTIFRERQRGKIAVLVLFPLMMGLMHNPRDHRVFAAMALSSLLAWIYRQLEDDLDLPAENTTPENRKLFRFFRGDRAIMSLDRSLEVDQAGGKAATLSQLKRWGYPVPSGWVLPPGDDPVPLLKFLSPSEEKPLAVRSSAIEEDSQRASAAGQYETVLNVTSRESLASAISTCRSSAERPHAVGYRQSQQLRTDAMAVLVQEQIQGVFSGVAFSRDPLLRQGDSVLIEALAGSPSQVVSGQTTPQRFRASVPNELVDDRSWVLPEDVDLPVEGESQEASPRLIQQVAFLARHIEQQYHGIPQDIEWTYDGDRLWVLQSRPITTLLPIWTRKIAAEVIPGVIRPLTWSINRPLTCGVWGNIFTIVLGDRARGLDFNETATLHFSQAYFNASLLADIFRRMGLPAESLEFLTRGSKLGKPPWTSTVRNIPGLWRLLRREMRLVEDFKRDHRRLLAPTLLQLRRDGGYGTGHRLDRMSERELLERVDRILQALQTTTYYNILAPLSLSLRRSLLRVKPENLNNSKLPEVAVTRSLQELADNARHLLGELEPETDAASLFATLAEMSDGGVILEQFDRIVQRYGYLSEVATDIAVPTWQEDPQPLRRLFAQQLISGETTVNQTATETISSPQRQRFGNWSFSWRVSAVQKRLNLKGQVAKSYNRLLAHLRWTFLAIGDRWVQRGILSEADDIFFLELAEIRRLVAGDEQLQQYSLSLLRDRRDRVNRDGEMQPPPSVVYGNDPPKTFSLPKPATQTMRGIGASPGQAEGMVQVVTSLQAMPPLDQPTILVVPYTDAGWVPILSRAAGIVASVGGILSHGAIVAREYGIPAVMDVEDATRRLQNGWRVRIDGTKGTVDILETESHETTES
jgi:pyruvate,water dikinase